MISEEMKAEILKEIEDVRYFKENFYKDEKHLTLLSTIKSHTHNQGDPNWDEDIDELFSFLYDNGNQLDFYSDSDDMYIKYDDMFYELQNMHGQGTYCSIEPINTEPEHFILLEDIVKYYETGKKPLHINLIEVVLKGLSAVKAVNGSSRIEINNEYMDIGFISDLVVEKFK